jgi:hypothetical protein
VPESVIQKFTPSLQTPRGTVPIPVAKKPREDRSAAFHSETLPPVWFVIIMRSPSNAADVGPLKPLPLRVTRTTPVAALITVTVFAAAFGT